MNSHKSGIYKIKIYDEIVHRLKELTDVDYKVMPRTIGSMRKKIESLRYFFGSQILQNSLKKKRTGIDILFMIIL
jgi:hypothetical protein